MITKRKVARWLYGSVEPRHPACAAWIYIALLIVVSAVWHGPPFIHKAIAACCAYRGEQVDNLAALRLVGSAFLITWWDGLAWSVLGLVFALPALERRVGTLAFLAIACLGHVCSTVISDMYAVVVGHSSTLHNMDVGSSVIMVTVVGALSIITMTWKVWFVLLWGLGIDTVTLHDQSTAEHYIGAVIGISIALILVNRMQLRKSVTTARQTRETV